jgi:sortase A
MTSVNDAPRAVATEPVATPEPTESRGRRGGAGAWSRVTSIAIVTLIVLATTWGLFQLFEGPVASAWNTRRQHYLADDMQAARVHKGAGHAIAILQVPRLHSNLVVAEGDTPQQLRNGPGHRTGTPMPGDIGNSVILGHRSAWGGSFEQLGDLKKDDLIVVQVPGKTDDDLPTNGVFKVVSIDKVGAANPKPFSGATDRRITLVTGAGGTMSNRRLVITAVSGNVGTVTPPPADVVTTTSGGSSLWNNEMLVAVLGIGGAVMLYFALRKRYSIAVVVTVAMPFAVIGLLSVLLNIDASLPPVR